jgi:hypothetical protein
MEEINEYLISAKEFARSALEASSPAVIIQDGFKAVEFALSAYSLKTSQRVPEDHWQTKNVAFRLGRSSGEMFNILLRFYLQSYHLKNGKRAETVKRYMQKILREVEKHVGEPILPE